MKLIIIGAGGTAQELLRRLGEAWEITLVETSPERLGAGRSIRPFTPVEGDGSSRVVLARAGLPSADALVATTGDDEVNLEACRLARDAGILRIMSVVNDPSRLEDYRRLQVGTASPHSLAARRLELSLETRRVSSTAFADGRAEAIEFRVAHDSPMRGRALRDLHAQTWIVGSILRDESLIVPHGDTVLETGDLVTVVGSGADFGQIVQSFTSGESRFPLDFGKRVAVVVERDSDLDGALDEATYLARNSRASSLLVVHRAHQEMRDQDEAERIRRLLSRAEESTGGVSMRRRGISGPPLRALARLPGEESIGVVVLPAPAGSTMLRTAHWARRAVALARRTGIPVLLSRSTHPYGRILLPARTTDVGRAAARPAIDLARFAGAAITALAAVDPVFMSGEKPREEARHALDWLTGEAAMQGVEVQGEIRNGNPVRVFLDADDGANLLVLGVSRHSRGPFRVDLARHLVRKARSSVLLIPAAS